MMGALKVERRSKANEPEGVSLAGPEDAKCSGEDEGKVGGCAMTARGWTGKAMLLTDVDHLENFTSLGRSRWTSSHKREARVAAGGTGRASA